MVYETLIKESADFLQSQERLASKAQVWDGLGLLGVLKTGQAKAGLTIGKASGFGRPISRKAFQACSPLTMNIVWGNYLSSNSVSYSPFCAVIKPGCPS